jgi:hypothetical protein
MSRRGKQIGLALALVATFGVTAFLFGPLGGAGALLVGILALAAWEVFVPDPSRPPVALRRSFWIGMLLPFALALLFLAERVVADDSEQLTAWRGLALSALALSIAWRGYRLAVARGAARRVEARLSIATGGVLLALGLYALSTPAGVEALGLEPAAAERTRGALGALWVAVLVVSLGALAFMELAYRVMPVEEAIELRRVDASAAHGLTLSLALVFVVSANFVALQRDVKRDLSYFKATRPSETTLRRVSTLSEPVRVVLFYPRVHEVLEQLRPFFDELDQASAQLTVEVMDHALAPELARRHRVRGNGFVLLLRGEGEGQQAESFEVGVELEAARSRLRTLDGRFQQHFAQLTVRPRALYVTSGHRERSASGADGDPPEQRLGELSSALQRSNIESRELGVAQGLATQVPTDAPAVAVVGPREPFLPEEAASLVRYVSSGGRLLVLVDPDVEHGLDPLLHALGLTLREGVLHSERNHVRRGEPPADRAVVFSNSYSAHPTVTLATRYRRAASIFDRGGALDRREDGQLERVQVTFPLWASDGYWLDRDGDHQRGEGEPNEGRFYPMAAVTVPGQGGSEGRAVVIADGDFITDAWIQNPGNAFVLMDTLNWLVGEEEVFGPTQTEEDVPIEHTRDEDKVWFYGTSFAVPLPLLLLGAWLARRRYLGRSKTEPKSPRAAATVETKRDQAPEARRDEAPKDDAGSNEAGSNEAGSSDAGSNEAAAEEEER